jgi:hypothetical protein
MATVNFKKPVNPFIKKEDDERSKIISRIGTEVDGVEAYARVLSMDDRLKDDRNVKGILHQVDMLRDLLEQIG